MIHEKRKLTKIIKEVTLYLFSVGTSKCKTEIEELEDEYIIYFEANYQEDKVEKLQRLEEYLMATRDDCMEDLYWELAGLGDPGDANELLLVGMMVDEAKIKITEHKIQIQLMKRKEVDG